MTDLKIEKRFVSHNEDIKFRAFEEDDKKIIEGYAAVFNSKSKLIAERGVMFHEIIEPGAFSDALQRSDLDVILVPNHNFNQVMARSVSGTLNLLEDETGLFFRAELANTTVANDLYELVKRGDMFENSFAFGITEEGFTWSRSEDEIPLRTIHKVNRIVDVSVVTRGIYSETEVSARGLNEFVKEDSEEEDKSSQNEQIKLRLKLIKIKNNNY